MDIEQAERINVKRCTGVEKERQRNARREFDA
jgi:hypothetical protein